MKESRGIVDINAVNRVSSNLPNVGQFRSAKRSELHRQYSMPTDAQVSEGEPGPIPRTREAFRTMR